MSVLVVDDSPIDRRLASVLLEKAGFSVRLAANGTEALAALVAEAADLVVTDLVMPGMDGLTLVESIRAQHAQIPVILMTAHGTDDTGVRALQRGAASFVPKRELAKALVETVRSILSLVAHHGGAAPLPESPLDLAQWELGNDPAEIGALISGVERQLAPGFPLDPTSRIQLSVALREAIVNAMIHGNLELTSELKESDPAEHERLAVERRTCPPYSARRVRVSLVQTSDAITCVVSDEGSGFDLGVVLDPLDPANLERVSGRGLFLVRSFMSEVSHSDGGRTITMVKRRG